MNIRIWLAALVVGASTLSAQTDKRWLPWLGCWQASAAETGEQSTSASATCIVPISGSSSVEMSTVARHRVVARTRLDASGRPHAFDGQGCDGMEVVNWSASGDRALIRSDYVCASGIKGSTVTIFSISSSGEFLRVEEVRSGGGTILSVSRLHDIGLLPVVSSEAARTIDSQRRVILAARAGAATPITADEVIDASNTLNGSVVRAWILASDPATGLDARQIAALSVPALAIAPVYPTAAQPVGNTYVSSSVYAPQNDDAYGRDGYRCFALSTLNCAFNPYSAYNGFYPLGFAVFRDAGFRGKDGHGFRSWDHSNGRPRTPWTARGGVPPIPRRPIGGPVRR